MKSAKRAGSLTQWIALCGCEALESAPPDESFTIKFCAICSKRISTERKGSLTQFIFRSDTCKCERPQAVEKTIEELALESPATAEEYTEEFSEEQLEQAIKDFSLGKEKFPFERYTPLKRLGEGASGVVFLARDRMLRKQVAIKCLHWLDQDRLVAFQNEARATSRLNHDSIVKVLDFGATTGGVPYMVMEYARGSSLAEVLDRHSKLTPLLSVSIVRKVAEALSSAHSQRVYHRDVKPSNMILSGDIDKDPTVKIIDFGVAQLRAETGKVTVINGHSLAGTPAYMAPELGQGVPYSQSSDVYSLGCVLFECLTGFVPFTANNALAVVRQHMDETPPMVADLVDGIPDELEDIVLQCIEKEPVHRYQSMEELVAALHAVEAVLQKQAVRAAQEAEGTGQKSYPGQPQSKKNVGLAIALGAILLAIGALLAYKQVYSVPTRKAVGLAPEEMPTPTAAKTEADFKTNTDIVDDTFDSMDLDGRLISKGKGTATNIRKFLSERKEARTVMLQSDELTDDMLPEIVNLKPTILSLANCRSLTDDGLKHLGKLAPGCNLTLDDDPQFSPKGYGNLALAPALAEISLKNCDLDDQDLKALAKLPYLQSLDIRNNPKCTLAGIKQLGPKQLRRYVNIAGTAAASSTPQQRKEFAMKYNITLTVTEKSTGFIDIDE